MGRLREAVARLRRETSTRVRTNRSHHDADDTLGAVGTVGTDDAIGFDPFPLLRSLHRPGAEAVVIGQVAGILHSTSPGNRRSEWAPPGPGWRG